MGHATGALRLLAPIALAELLGQRPVGQADASMRGEKKAPEGALGSLLGTGQAQALP